MATTFLLVAPPVDIVRERLITEFQARTGYLLEINGTTSLRLQPAPTIEFRDVVVATAGENGSPVLRAEAIEVEPRLMGLFWGRVEAERIVVRRPQLDLVIDAEGRRKWLRAEQDDGATATRSRGASACRRIARPLLDAGAAGSSAPEEPRDRGEAVIRPRRGPKSDPALEVSSDGKPRSRANQMPAIRIADGIVRYRDLRTGTLVQSDQIQVRVNQRAGKALPLQARGSFAYAAARP